MSVRTTIDIPDDLMSDEKTQYLSLAELENDDVPIVGLLSQFEVDQNVLVKMNPELTIEAIGKLERDEIANLRKNFEDRDLLDSLITDHEVYCEDLRRSANNLAVVGLVTRFQHWIAKFVKDVGGKPSKLGRTLEQLNEVLGK